MILLDSNVLVAALIESHPHNEVSASAVIDADPAGTIIAAHSLAETYAVLTRRNLHFRLSGSDAYAQIRRFSDRFTIVSLTAAESLDAIRQFSTLGIGPRLYDYLIGATGTAHGADTLVTWNTRDFDGLFPRLRIVTPAALLPSSPRLRL